MAVIDWTMAFAPHSRMPGSTPLMSCLLIATLAAACASSDEPPTQAAAESAVTSLAVNQDPLVRVPGTQPLGAGPMESSQSCLQCHGGYNSRVEPGHNWQGSMMGQAARDPLFWACFTVSAQDSQWALGRPNATDLCERCHFPEGWLEDRSDPTNASAMKGSDYDGVTCDLCHRMYDPHFKDTVAGTREGSDWKGYWDEATAASTAAAAKTAKDDASQAAKLTLFNGNAAFVNDAPASAQYTEAAAGQFFVAGSAPKRGPFQDAGAVHPMLYSRFNKSRYFCASCHDVSNPALANLAHKALKPGDKKTVLPSEKLAAYSYIHVERTFSEFMLSAYGKQGGADGVGPFAPAKFKTSRPGNKIATCQDCHMRDVSGVAANKSSAINRPSGSKEHPKSGIPLHDLTGGNIWVGALLASTVTTSSNYSPGNAALLRQGAAKLTLDLKLGVGLDSKALLDGVDRAKQQLKLAASIDGLSYNTSSGALAFRVTNQTGHKLISGFPEGRRMFVNVKLYKGATLLREINPYDAAAGTLKGMPASPTLSSHERHLGALVYESKPSSTITKENHNFHFVLADGRYKDNRIPPRGFAISQAAARLCRPVENGVASPGLYTAAEYVGGYDQVNLTVPAGGDSVVVGLYYQVTSREYVTFLRDEIKGTGSTTLPKAAYIIQTDPWFAKLRAWGDTIWNLWWNNRAWPGAAPYLMTSAATGSTGGCAAKAPALLTATPGAEQVALAWTNLHGANPLVTGYRVYYDQAGKSQLVATLGKTASYLDSGLTGGQSHCYKVSTLYAGCESVAGAVKCATPTKKAGKGCLTAATCQSGFCIDGVCCASACGGGSAKDCQACSQAAGAAKDGTCSLLSFYTVCRKAAGVCDEEETCTGSAALCPADKKKPNGFPCAAGAGTCQGGACQLKPDAGPPRDGAAPDAPAPDLSKPDLSKPDLVKPDLPKPDLSKPDLALADQRAPDRLITEASAGDLPPADLPASGDLPGGDIAADRGATTPPDPGDDGCSCNAGGGGRGSAALLLVIVLLVRRRKWLSA